MEDLPPPPPSLEILHPYTLSLSLSHTHTHSRLSCQPVSTHQGRFPSYNMAKFRTFETLVLCLLLVLTTFLSNPPSAAAKSPRPIQDYEIREKKEQCYADVESGLWGSQCKSSMVAKENCALQCLSPPCYELVYESDPLEEGEKDFVRSKEYKFCMHRLSLGESLKGVKGSFNY